MSRAQLSNLVQETGARSVTRLLFQARKKGFNPTKADLQAVIKHLGEKQIFAPIQPSRGKTASDAINGRFMADLADFKLNSNNDGEKYFLIVGNVFTREAYTRPLMNKEQKTVSPALQELLREAGAEEGGSELTTDGGAEFKGLTEKMLTDEDFAHRTKTSKLDKNALSVVDRMIQNIKGRIVEILAKTQKK